MHCFRLFGLASPAKVSDFINATVTSIMERMKNYHNFMRAFVTGAKTKVLVSDRTTENIKSCL